MVYISSITIGTEQALDTLERMKLFKSFFFIRVNFGFYLIWIIFFPYPEMHNTKKNITNSTTHSHF